MADAKVVPVESKVETRLKKGDLVRFSHRGWQEHKDLAQWGVSRETIWTVHRIVPNTGDPESWSVEAYRGDDSTNPEKWLRMQPMYTYIKL